MGDIMSTFSSGDEQDSVLQNNYDKLDEDAKRFLKQQMKRQKDLEMEKGQLRSYNTILEEKVKMLEGQMSKQNNQNISSDPKYTQRKHDNVKIPKSISETTHMIEECMTQQAKLQSEKDEMERRLLSVEKEAKTFFEENKRLRSDNQILSSEKENALSRLSKIAGIQLTKGNSDIADLSDVNRPTSLGEKWSSLYTDEWSEAYDELTMGKTIKNENCRVEKELCKIAQKIYGMCQQMEKQQITDIKSHAWDIACCLHQQPDQLVSATQTTQYYNVIKATPGRKVLTTTPNRNNEVVTNTEKLRAIQKCMEELIQIVHERRKYDKNLMEYVVQEIVGKFSQYDKMNSKGQVIKFIKRCTELCWNMVIKEPPMVLVFDQMEGKKIDKNVFSIYTKKGVYIDFVVWPALLLCRNGNVLSKGTVQGKDIPTVTKEGDTMLGKEKSIDIEKGESVQGKYLPSATKEGVKTQGKNTPAVFQKGDTVQISKKEDRVQGNDIPTDTKKERTTQTKDTSKVTKNSETMPGEAVTADTKMVGSMHGKGTGVNTKEGGWKKSIQRQNSVPTERTENKLGSTERTNSAGKTRVNHADTFVVHGSVKGIDNIKAIIPDKGGNIIMKDRSEQ